MIERAQIVYITRDIERAAGLLGTGMFVVTNENPLAEAMAAQYSDQFLLINDRRAWSTFELLKLEKTREFVEKNIKGGKPQILVFKTSPQIERECGRLGWKLLNPSYEAGAVLEEKIGQWKWLSTLRQAQGDNCEFELPKVWVGELLSRSYKEIVPELGERPVVQFNRGHTGLGTFRLETEKQWKELQERFPRREVKVMRWYEGAPYTLNAVVCPCRPEPSRRVAGEMLRQAQHDTGVIVGNISKQLTGIPGCTNNPYATVGNDWSEGAKLTDEIKSKIYSCAEVVGKALAQRVYKGLFGIDVIVTNDNKVILIEVNPRQPASASLESQLQKEKGQTTIMGMHIGALCGKEFRILDLESWIEGGQKQNSQIPDSRFQIPLNGFQLFFRNTENRPVQLKSVLTPGRYRVAKTGIEFVEKAARVIDAREGEVFAFSVSNNERVKPGGELLRIQAKNGMIDALGKDWKSAIEAIRAPLEVT